MQALLISQVLLWLLVLALSFVCLALARQVGVLHERIAPAGALAMNRRLTGGQRAPVMEVTSLQGEALTVGVHPDAAPAMHSRLLFFVSPSCPVCKQLLPVLRSIQREKQAQLDIILASDGDHPDIHRRFIEEQGLERFPYVVSEALGRSYGVGKLPYAVLIDPKGVISALGLVNTREHLESLFEAQALNRPTLQDYLHGATEPAISTEARKTA